MSEYQYYEFLAVDRPLGAREIDDVREYSTRADITATRFVNEYHWGDFRGDPDEFLTNWFDLMVYVANWGTRRLAIALPIESAAEDVTSWRDFESESGMEIRKGSRRIIVDFWSENEEGEDFVEGEGWMASLAPVREELLEGDTRGLFLGWLAGVCGGGVEDESLAPPPIPAGLADLTTAQRSLVDFLRVDEDLLAVAAGESAARRPPADKLSEWIAALAQQEKDQALRDLISGDDPQAARKLMRRYQRSIKSPPGEGSTSSQSIGQWLRAAEGMREARLADARRKAAAERARRQAAEAAAREKQLDQLARRQDQAWKQIEGLIILKQAKMYDQAVTILRDLRDLAIRQHALDRFAERVNALREAHRAKVSFVQRVAKAGLIQ